MSKEKPSARRQKHNGMSWSKAGSHALTALNAGVFSDECENAELLSSLCRKLPNLTVQVKIFEARYVLNQCMHMEC
jgi:hypothetical protein